MEYMAKASQIISYEEIVLVWEKIPQTMQTRTPKLVYRARTNGPNLDNTYFIKVKPFESDLKSSLLIARTKQDETYGLFLDDMIRLHMEGYAGQFQNFLFSSVRGVFLFYKPTSVNPRDFKSDDQLFEIGPSRSVARDNPAKILLCPLFSLQYKNKTNSDSILNSTKSSSETSQIETKQMGIELSLTVQGNQR